PHCRVRWVKNAWFADLTASRARVRFWEVVVGSVRLVASLHRKCLGARQPARRRELRAEAFSISKRLGEPRRERKELLARENEGRRKRQLRPEVSNGAFKVRR